jgi:hypothetical protein
MRRRLSAGRSARVRHTEHRSRWHHALLEAGFRRPSDRVFVERLKPTPGPELRRLLDVWGADAADAAADHEVLVGATVYLARLP